MNRSRTVMWSLLAVVASAAAVLSFDSLRALAALCGFSPGLSPLLPVVIDAGAAAGCLTWMGVAAPPGARRYARTLTLVLLVASVAGNAVVHGLAAYGLRPEWWLVVTVSAAAPAVLGAVVHLAVLVGRPPRAEQPAATVDPRHLTPTADKAPSAEATPEPSARSASRNGDSPAKPRTRKQAMTEEQKKAAAAKRQRDARARRAEKRPMEVAA